MSNSLNNRIYYNQHQLQHQQHQHHQQIQQYHHYKEHLAKPFKRWRLNISAILLFINLWIILNLIFILSNILDGADGLPINVKDYQSTNFNNNWNNVSNYENHDHNNNDDDDDDDAVDIIDRAAASLIMDNMAKSQIVSGCPSTTSSHCLRCNHDGCVKCPTLLVTDTRQCVEHCPSGYIEQWSPHTEVMGRVCIPSDYSGPLLAALAGLIGGFLVCFSLLALAVMLMRRRRRRKTIKQKLINDQTIDRSDFLRQLNEMRPNAEYFLAMLNDARRQIRKLYLTGEMAAANSYRPVVRDLAKILILLNRPIELIPAAPHDWNRLYGWSEQALKRYKAEVSQLIDFFQAPNSASSDCDSQTMQPKGAGVLSSCLLQSETTNLNGKQKLNIFGSLISLQEFEEPRSSNPFGFSTLKGNNNMFTDLTASSLWLEDEFYKLGFRPQDEITTEL